ncbi:MAG: carboxypeptidase regulatory-like domain-containing protein, partial [Holophaga sp.]|nr:carboxypeptidase regulatory-like domain-containing protein [Holophaga sp.]
MAHSKGLTSLSALAVLLVAAPCSLVAQGNTTSALTGVVRDPSGKPLAGVVVRITSGAMIGGEKTMTTSENGSYRFPMLVPGLYKIVVEAQGYPSLSGQEFLELGRTSAVNWKFRVAASATVEVVSDNASASTEAVGVTTSFSSDVLANVPTGRDLTQVASLTPGVNVTDTTSGAAVKAWGGDIYGNSYAIDGLNVGDAKSGEKWVYANPDWFSQVQVSGLGGSAEFGGYSGAVINGVVKSGGNTVEGLLSVYYQKNSWAALRNNERIAPADRPLYDGEYASYGASLGGPILKDKLWYFVSVESNTDSAQDSPVGVAFPVKLTNPRFLGKVTWQALPNATWDAFLEYDKVDRENRYATRYYAKNATQIQKSPSTLFTTSWTQAIGQSVVTLRYAGLTARDDRSSYNPGGYTMEVSGALQPGVMTANGLSEVAYPELIDKSYWGNVRRSNMLRENARGRHTLSGTLDIFGSGLLTASDSHAMRLGFEVEKSLNEEKRWIASPNGIAYRTRARVSGGVLGLRPYRAVTGGGRDVKTDMERTMFFLQDTWTVNSRLQIRPGLRYEAFKGGAKGGDKIWSTSTLAPRLGFTYNVTENQSQVAKLHFGRYFTAMSSDYFQRAIPGVYDNTNAFYWGGSSNLVNPYNPTLIPVNTTVGGPDYAYAYNFNVSTLDPNHKQPYQDEALFSYDVKLGREWSVGLTAVYRS